MAPVGQADLCLEVLRESADAEEIKQHLRAEYLAIALALQQLEVEFRVVYSHPDLFDRPVTESLVKYGCRFVKFGEGFWPPSVVYPRDFCAVFTKLVLVNPTVQVVRPEKNGWTILSSPFGEGGRVLMAGSKAVLSERICVKDGASRLTNDADLEPIRKMGVETSLFPAPILRYVTRDEGLGNFAFSDHLDRAAAMVTDRWEHLHLVIDSRILTARMVDEKARRWEPMSPGETRCLLAKRLEPMGILVDLAPPPAVPYGLNLLQFPDGRVLMSGGDPELREFIGLLVGAEKIMETCVPIRYIPTYLYAGIRCLVSEAPEPLIVKK